jgi:hypothetical protein
MTVGPPATDCVTLFVKSRAPRAQLVLVIDPALESIVVVPAALQFQLGDVLKLVFHCVASTSTDGGTATFVQPEHTPLTHVWLPVQMCPVPQPPQLLLSVCSLTQAPLHALKPLLHVKVHAPALQVAVALATPVVQATAEPHAPLALQVSTPLPEQVV